MVTKLEKIRGPTMNREVGLHGRCNGGAKGEYCNAQKENPSHTIASAVPSGVCHVKRDEGDDCNMTFSDKSGC